MYTNGGKSHFTPITHLCRALTYDGSAGSFALAAAAPPVPDVADTPTAANVSDAATAARNAAPFRCFIRLLLPRYERDLTTTRPAEAYAAESAVSSLP